MLFQEGDRVKVSDRAAGTIKEPWVGHSGVVDKVLLGGNTVSVKWVNPEGAPYGEFGGIVISPDYLDMIEPIAPELDADVVRIYMPGLQRQVELKPGRYWLWHDDEGMAYFSDAASNIYRGETSDYVAPRESE